MAGFLYNLGKKSGPAVRKGAWVFKSLTGSEDEAIDAETQVGADLAKALRDEMMVDDPQAPQVPSQPHRPSSVDKDTSGDHAEDDEQPAAAAVQPSRISAEAEQWFQHMGEALSARVLQKQRRFDFTIANTQEPNAFALPGGFIFVSRALLDLCEWNRDEVAFVMGHEMGHVVKGHAIDRIMNSGAFTAASRALPAAGVLGAWMKRTGVKFLHSAYSQEAEFEADFFGAKITAATGLDPRGGIRLLERLRALSPEQTSTLGEYFATHPPTDARIEKLDRAIRS